jgi:hypothetical protein
MSDMSQGSDDDAVNQATTSMLQRSEDDQDAEYSDEDSTRSDLALSRDKFEPKGLSMAGRDTNETNDYASDEFEQDGDDDQDAPMTKNVGSARTDEVHVESRKTVALDNVEEERQRDIEKIWARWNSADSLVAKAPELVEPTHNVPHVDNTLDGGGDSVGMPLNTDDAILPEKNFDLREVWIACRTCCWLIDGLSD